jgi:hypothetical protein
MIRSVGFEKAWLAFIPVIEGADGNLVLQLRTGSGVAATFQHRILELGLRIRSIAAGLSRSSFCNTASSMPREASIPNSFQTV